MRLRRALPPALVALALCLPGCGSSPLSLRDLRQGATSICQTAARRTARIPAPATPEGTRAFLAAGATVLTRELHDLRGLTPEGANAATFHTGTGALAESINLLQQARTAIHHGTDPAAAIRGLQSSLVAVQARGTQAWRALGIPACAAR